MSMTRSLHPNRLETVAALDLLSHTAARCATLGLLPEPATPKNRLTWDSPMLPWKPPALWCAASELKRRGSMTLIGVTTGSAGIRFGGVC